MKQLFFLSLIMVIIVVPTRLAGHPRTRGPQRTVFFYLVAACIYYVLIRVVIPRIS